MKQLKLLPVGAAVVSVLSFNALADADDVINGLYFEGYARYGAHYQGGDSAYVGAVGDTMNHSVGRLGNESNGGEFQIGTNLESSNGTKWDVAFMLEEYGGQGVDLKKFYAKATNVFESQPGMTIWAGRDFHQRPQSGLNDYFIMSHDGQGAGVYDMSLGGVMLDLGFVAKPEDPVADSGDYAFTSNLHGIGIGFGELSLVFDLGFGSEQSPNTDSSYLFAGIIDMNSDNGRNQIVLRYADGADNSVYTRDEDLSTLFLQWEGAQAFSSNFELGYLAAYHDLTNDSPASDATSSRTNYSFIARPMYSWNSIHSTWLEAGYSIVDYKDLGENSAWKLTLSQNISFGEAMSGDRPMLRFYATFGDTDNQVVQGSGGADPDLIAGSMDTMSLGAMFEAWW